MPAGPADGIKTPGYFIDRRGMMPSDGMIKIRCIPLQAC
jgi:hypothetical protein